MHVLHGGSGLNLLIQCNSSAVLNSSPVEAELTPDQFIHVLSFIDGNVFEFYRELGIHVDDERDGRTSRDNMASRVFRENPGISWRRILEALRRVGMTDQASNLERRILFETI